MSEAAAYGQSPLIPPKANAEELRAALVRIAPSRVAAFDAARTAAMAEARDKVDAAPMRRFLRTWALTVAVERHPNRAARLSTLQARANEVTDLAEWRAITAEVADIQRQAAAEAGIDERTAVRHRG